MAPPRERRELDLQTCCLLPATPVPPHTTLHSHAAGSWSGIPGHVPGEPGQMCPEPPVGHTGGAGAPPTPGQPPPSSADPAQPYTASTVWKVGEGPWGLPWLQISPMFPIWPIRPPPPGGSKPQTDAFSASNTMQCGSFPRHWAPHSQPHPAQDVTSGGIHSPASLTLRR